MTADQQWYNSNGWRFRITSYRKATVLVSVVVEKVEENQYFSVYFNTKNDWPRDIQLRREDTRLHEQKRLYVPKSKTVSK